MSYLSDTASLILVILNNVNDLIVKSSDRQNAKDVMRALKVYAKNKQFPLSEDKLNDFDAILIDARPYTLTTIIKDIAQDVIASDKKMLKKTKS